MSGYTVIDFETTGFSPRHHDRVVEVGVVYVSLDGVIQDHWGTLVNPKRDLGATYVHGIAAADVLDAPTFDQVAPYLLEAMAGRVVVAHNARFDLNFLEHECQSSGFALGPGVPALCTMQWSRQFLGAASRKLSDCCAAAGVVHERAHSASSDALATAQLLAHFIRSAGTPPPWASTLAEAATFDWPRRGGELPPITMALRREAGARPDAWLDRVTSNLPRVENPAVESYFDVLERALLDGHLSEHEKQELVDAAVELGLHRDDIDKVHAAYLKALAGAAWADGVVTGDEQQQLLQVAATLGIEAEVAEQVLREAEGAAAPFELPALHLVPGDRVVFTGELGREREEWVARIAELGLETGAVTKVTRVVVAADPDSLSGKAAKAREYGVPIITEAAFEAVVSALEERRRRRSQALSD